MPNKKYTLVLTINNQDIVLAKTSLEEIDQITTEFSSEKHLLKILGQKYKKDLNKGKLSIHYQMNGDRIAAPLYIKQRYLFKETDLEKTKKIIFNTVARAAFYDRNYAIALADKYVNSSSKLIHEQSARIIREAVQMIRTCDYAESVRYLLNILLKSYKTTRDLYLFHLSKQPVPILEHEYLTKENKELIQLLDSLKEEIEVLNKLKPKHRGEQEQTKLDEWLTEMKRCNDSEGAFQLEDQMKQNIGEYDLERLNALKSDDESGFTRKRR